ncbi:PAS domain-containing protein [Psychrobacter frigidicola]|uniref:histidine kinase n=1 Tax=Psychrobacter frigidicola TaxID=45611 RepID=A0A5C7A4I2_9GAMM|nr:ATP-binding protein [Psychrobacter frigidicola]TXD97524.1 PAS domain-containing protein [Psychrobacter frigidicola]
MKTASSAIATVIDYLHQGDALPSPQLRRLGLTYSSYRLVISIFFILMSYLTIKSDVNVLLPTLLQQTALGFYLLLSLILFGLFYVVTKQLRRQLAFGLTLDVIFLSLLLYTNGAPDLQLTMLYMVVVAASFMLLHGSQAVIITLLAIIFVIYQQFFYAIANSMSLTNLGDALLMSVSFLAVGFLSWSVSQRLVQVEKMAVKHAQEVERLNTINQEVISQMLNGVIVIDQGHIVLANAATYQLLGIINKLIIPHPHAQTPPNSTSWYISIFKRQRRTAANQTERLLIAFQQQVQSQHTLLLDSCSAVGVGQSRSFIYELPPTPTASVMNKLRVQIIPLKDYSQLVLLEDLRREQASAQQLKLASLGQLTASIAHEIRNPLAAISQASQLLMEDIVDSVEGNDSASAPTLHNDDIAGNHELYKMIFAQTKRVNRIIEDVLKLSRQQLPNQRPIALADWMPQFLDNYFRGQDVFLQIHSQPIIRFDTHQLEQVLINLINNGLHYSSYAHPHAYVEVEIHCAQNDVIIDVLDTGAGIDTANLEQLFNPFFTTDKAGTGLGLYLSQAFSEANHARLLYVPDHEKTCFRLIIPVVSCPTNPNPKQ